MPVHNADIAAIFEEIAELLEIQSANPFRIRAYRNAALTVSDFGRDLAARQQNRNGKASSSDSFDIPHG